MSSVTPGFELKEKVESLKTMILEKHPRMPTLLSEIHRAIQAQPEQVTLLDENELAVIVSGLKQQTGVEFAKAATKVSAPKTKSLAARIASGALDL